MPFDLFSNNWGPIEEARHVSFKDDPNYAAHAKYLEEAGYGPDDYWDMPSASRFMLFMPIDKITAFTSPLNQAISIIAAWALNSEQKEQKHVNQAPLIIAPTQPSLDTFALAAPPLQKTNSFNLYEHYKITTYEPKDSFALKHDVLWLNPSQKIIETEPASLSYSPTQTVIPSYIEHPYLSFLYNPLLTLPPTELIDLNKDLRFDPKIIEIANSTLLNPPPITQKKTSKPKILPFHEQTTPFDSTALETSPTEPNFSTPEKKIQEIHPLLLPAPPKTIDLKNDARMDPELIQESNRQELEKQVKEKKIKSSAVTTSSPPPPPPNPGTNKEQDPPPPKPEAKNTHEISPLNGNNLVAGSPGGEPPGGPSAGTGVEDEDNKKKKENKKQKTNSPNSPNGPWNLFGDELQKTWNMISDILRKNWATLHLLDTWDREWEDKDEFEDMTIYLHGLDPDEVITNIDVTYREER
ncbi:MAG: hypothetical protein CMO81_11105 [Waddliaceae bacterium]|nr:hypothetical protein [Waddliaceae bacterium]